MTHSNPTLEQVARLQARSERLQRLREMLEVLIASEARVGPLELGALLEVADSAVAPPPPPAPHVHKSTDAPGVDLEAAAFDTDSFTQFGCRAWQILGNGFNGGKVVPLSVAQAVISKLCVEVDYWKGQAKAGWRNRDAQRARAEAAETALATEREDCRNWESMYTEAERDRKQAETKFRNYFMEIEQREAECCPEDVGFDEYIAVLAKRAESAEREAAGLRERVAYFEKAFYYLNRKLCGFSDKDLAALAKQANTDGEVWEDGV
jgi:hypothetical protein